MWPRVQVQCFSDTRPGGRCGVYSASGVSSSSSSGSTGISKLGASELDAVAQRWYTRAADGLGDANLYDLSLCIDVLEHIHEEGS